MRESKNGSRRVTTSAPTMQGPNSGAERRKKLAVVYVRTATADGTAAIQQQRALSVRAREWGWSEKLIKTIADVGWSGCSTRRAGFQELMKLMDQGRVGLVIVRDVSRLGRNLCDVGLFITKAIQRDVLIAVDGRIRRPTVFGKLGGFPLHSPFGYVLAEGGKWSRSPDPAVRNALPTVFALYRRGWSARDIANTLNKARLATRADRPPRKRV